MYKVIIIICFVWSCTVDGIQIKLLTLPDNIPMFLQSFQSINLSLGNPDIFAILLVIYMLIN